jgi:hypothetical protein
MPTGKFLALGGLKGLVGWVLVKGSSDHTLSSVLAKWGSEDLLHSVVLRILIL